MGVHAEFFEGIHGKTFRVGAAEPTSQKPDGTPWYISQGHIGLCLSHYMVWSHLWHSGVEEAIILEDDAYITSDFHPQYRQVRNDLPNDWELCYLGWLHGGHDRKMHKVKGRIHTVEGCPFGTHAMLLRRSAIRTLLDTQRCFKQHIDINIAERSLDKIRTYFVYPSIITQRSQNGKREKPGEFRPTV